jgi:putative DNA primase/helicase
MTEAEAIRAAVHAYVIRGRLALHPADAGKRPLSPHGCKDATSDLTVIEGWLRRWPFCEWAWAVTASVVVVDIDVKHGKNGYRDFESLAGCDARSVSTRIALTPSGGAQLFYRALKPYRNRVAIPGAPGIDTRSLGGYVLLPLPHNARTWLRQAPLLPAPDWLDAAARKEIVPTTGIAAPLSNDVSVRSRGRAALARACEHIVNAPCGEQHDTLNREVYTIGGFVARGDLDEAEAYDALLAAARSMPAHRGPWRDFSDEISNTLAVGATRPLPLSITDRFLRDLKARMRLRRPSHG